MTISLTLLRKPYRSIEERLSSKISLAYDVFKFYSGHFSPSKIEVWRNASLKALGGEILTQIECKDQKIVLNCLNQVFEESRGNWPLNSLIILLRGSWKLDDQSMAGYFSINNEESAQQTYGDIEIGAFPRGEIADLVDLFWLEPSKTHTLVYNFISQLAEFEDDSHTISHIVAGAGAPLAQLVSEWKASHHKVPFHFLTTLVSTMREKEREISSHVRMMNMMAVTSELYRIGHFKTKLRLIASRNEVELSERNSLTLVGKRADSYSRMYEELANFLTPIILESLPSDRKITGEMARSIAKQLGMTLDQ